MTSPVKPSTVTIWPSRRSRVALPVASTAGTRYSRAMIAGWEQATGVGDQGADAREEQGPRSGGLRTDQDVAGLELAELGLVGNDARGAGVPAGTGEGFAVFKANVAASSRYRPQTRIRLRHEALLSRMEVRDRPSPRRRSGGVKLEAA